MGNPYFRRAGLNYELEFVSELDSQLREMCICIHRPKIVFDDSWSHQQIKFQMQRADRFQGVVLY